MKMMMTRGDEGDDDRWGCHEDTRTIWFVILYLKVFSRVMILVVCHPKKMTGGAEDVSLETRL